MSSHPNGFRRPVSLLTTGPDLDVTADDREVLWAELHGLRQKLASLPVIEQAKGLLMGLYGVDADTAFTILQRWSSHTNTKLRCLSAELIDAASNPGPGESA